MTGTSGDPATRTNPLPWKWLNTFVEEKEIDMERTFEYEIDGVWHYMPVGVIVENMHCAPRTEKDSIKRTIVKLDFLNRNIYDYLEFLGLCLIKQRGVA